MSVRLFVGNLPPQLCFPELEDLFLPFGTIVSADLMTDPTTGRSRGFGFVEMESGDAARAAISALHGSNLDGQVLTVNEAHPGRGMGAPRTESTRPQPSSGNTERPASTGGGGRGSGVRLFVGNLPYTATNADLERVFSEAGKVTSVSVMTDRATGQSKGFAFIDMATKDEASAAIKRFDGREALGRVLKVNEARPPERRSGGFSGGGRRY
ncbi:MAG: RNA recognition motif domain-containing protein [Candidatus Binatia bacterium]